MRISERSWTIKPGLVTSSYTHLDNKSNVFFLLLFKFSPSLSCQTHQGRDCAEEAASAVSDERSSCTLSGAYPSDIPIGCAQGIVRKAGALAVKNFLVHKKNKKVEPATKRKWKHYWVSLKGEHRASYFDLWVCFLQIHNVPFR